MWTFQCKRTPPSKQKYKFIIVGAGSAGCLLANRLSACGNHSVLLLEAGSYRPFSFFSPLLHVPAGYLGCVGNPSVDWLLATNKDPGLGGRSLKYPRGKVLGGCSAINGMIYNCGQVRDYQVWSEATTSVSTSSDDKIWTWEQCLPYFRKHQKHWNVERIKNDPNGFGKLHSADGEFPIEKVTFRYPILDAVKEAFVQYGVPENDDFNSGDNTGVGYYEVNQRRGRRVSTASAFLPNAVKSRKNLEVVVGATVGKLKISRSNKSISSSLEVTGLHGVMGDAKTKNKKQFEVELEDGGELILCAGAIHSPALLQVSGIGPKEVVSGVLVGVDQKLVLPQVGRNMEDHLQIRPIFKIKENQSCSKNVFFPAYPRISNAITLNKIVREITKPQESGYLKSLRLSAKIGLDYVLRGTGPPSMAPSQLGAFLNSKGPSATRSAKKISSSSSSSSYLPSNIQYHVQPLSLDAFGQPLHDFEAITMSVCNLNPTSTGSVTAINAKDLTNPNNIKIVTNYLSTEHDRRVAYESLQVTKEVMSQKALAETVEPEPYNISKEEYAKIPPVSSSSGSTNSEGCSLDKDHFDNVVKICGRIATTIFHPACTLKMGTSVENSCCDSMLRVHGVKNLRVADCSVMPCITSGNTNAPVLMIAERAAEWILKDAK